ncbi:hypothetical protein [Streptomyces sp. NPDC057250]|uniref:hypothetical protein n=1 Tax=Streptomyces sp. NPDC057250 TaxID=3346068 RepID=UPI00363182D8
MLQIQIGTQTPAATDDPLCRAVLGWAPGMSEDQVWAVARGVWKLNPDRARDEAEAQIVNTAGTVLAVARILAVAPVGDRYVLDGELLRGDPRVGALTPHPHPSRNPVAYV